MKRLIKKDNVFKREYLYTKGEILGDFLIPIKKLRNKMEKNISKKQHYLFYLMFDYVFFWLKMRFFKK